MLVAVSPVHVVIGVALATSVSHDHTSEPPAHVLLFWETGHAWPAVQLLELLSHAHWMHKLTEGLRNCPHTEHPAAETAMKVAHMVTPTSVFVTHMLMFLYCGYYC